jgi:hypothetical protein
MARPLLLVLAWLVPGLGHLLLGRYKRAAVFGFVVIASFVTGILLSGEVAGLQRGNPFSYLTTIGCLGNGLLYFISKQLGIGLGDPTAAGFNYGNTFLYTAGLMNLLVILDVSDIAVGRKE